MRFRMVSILAGAAVLALSAGGALAAVDTLDQHQDSGTVVWDAGDTPTAQTFTAGVSGHIDRVALWGVEPSGSWGPITVAIRSGGPAGALLGTSSPMSSAGDGAWVSADFSPAVQVANGSTYAIVLNVSGGGAVRIGGTCGANAYSGGEALGLWSNVWQPLGSTPHFDSCVTDLAFQTYMAPAAPAQTAKLKWDKAQVAAGQTTPLTLTETFTFAEIVGAPEAAAPAAPSVSDWTIQQVALPAWFHVGSVSCLTPQIAHADCILANVAVGASIPVTPDGNPITVKLIGTASPDPSAAGTTGTATGEGCSTTVTVDAVVCITDQATVAVGASTVTAPPTTTVATGPIGDSTPLLPLLACLAFGGLGIAAVELQRRSIRR
jgi:hypothetical protein